MDVDLVSRRGEASFRWLWRSFVVTSIGSGVAAGLLPLVAVTALKASPTAVTLMSASSLVSGAVAAPWAARVLRVFPIRWVLLCTESAQAMALVVLLVAAARSVVSLAMLTVVAAVETCGFLVYAATVALVVKQVTGAGRLVGRSGRLEAVTWTAQALGPVLGGLLVTTVGWRAALTVDAVSFAGSAAAVTGIVLPPVASVESGGRTDGAAGGLGVIVADRLLRRLFANALALGGALLLVTSVLPVLVLRTLGLSALQYGIVLGIPAVFGLGGSLAAARVTTVLGVRTVLVWFGALRGFALVPLAFVSPGRWAFPTVMAAECLLLLAAGVFNPCFAAVRLSLLAEGEVVPVTTTWSAASKIVQPLCIALGGLVAAGWGLRAVLAVAASQGVVSAVPLPWRRRVEVPDLSTSRARAEVNPEG